MCALSQVMGEVVESKRDVYLDALRYDFLRKHRTYRAPGNYSGPEHPKLLFDWDIWNESPEIAPQDGLDAAVDIAMTKQRAKDLI